MSEINSICPICKKELPVAGAAFCPFCGAALKRTDAVPSNVAKWLEQIKATDDPVKKHKLLLSAREDCPDSLEIEREILHLGRLYERNAKKLNFAVIKCYVLHFYLTPGDFSPETVADMRQELFHDEQLKRCQALAPDPDAFTREYLERLSREFVQLFLEGSNYYMHSIFGFNLRKNAAKLLAEPAAKMLLNMRADDQLTGDERDMLMNAFFIAFGKQMNQETEHLRQRLLEAGLTMPV